MSHPIGISCRWQRTISRTRRRMRLRTIAPPSAFLMLKPKRFKASSLRRTKTVKWELEKRFPARYTASNSPRRTNRASRGNVWSDAGAPPLFGCEAMTSLFTAGRKDFATSFSLHTRAEPMSFRAASFPRLKSTLWQIIPPCLYKGRHPRAFLIHNYVEACPSLYPNFGVCHRDASIPFASQKTGASLASATKGSRAPLRPNW